MLSRRGMLRIGGVVLAGLPLSRAAAQNSDVVEITMSGNKDGSAVWFDPVGVLVRPGQTVRWTNRDPGNSHTSTAYHPDNDDHPLRVPARASPWDSDYLLPDQSFETVLNIPGVYDFYCVPHEHAGMVGRLVLLPEDGSVPVPPTGSPVAGAEAVLFPSVEDIVRLGRVRSPRAA